MSNVRSRRQSAWTSNETKAQLVLCTFGYPDRRLPRRLCSVSPVAAVKCGGVGAKIATRGGNSNKPKSRSQLQPWECNRGLTC